MKLKHITSTNLHLSSEKVSLSELLKTMEKNKISSIVIVDDSIKPVGIFTEFDAIRVVASSMDIANFTAKDIINPNGLFVLNQNEEIYKAFDIMQDKHCRHIIATDDDGKVVGIATQSDFLKYLDTEVLIKLKNVDDVMIRDVITINPDYTISDAAMIMMQHKISCLIVINELKVPIGILTERDMVRYANKNKHLEKVNKIMSTPVMTINKDYLLSTAIKHMENHKIRRIVAVDENGILSGIITRHDILKSIQHKKIEILTHTIKQKNYELEIIKRQDEELRLLDVALKASANAVVITDLDATIKWCNKAFEELTGYKTKEIIGKKPKDLVGSGMQSKEFYEILWNTILSKQSFKGEVVNRKKNGEYYNEKITITPIVDDNDEITHFVAIKEDITQLKNMQKTLVENEMRFKSLFDNAPLPYQSLNTNGEIIEVNHAWLEFSEYDYREVIGKFIGNFLQESQDTSNLQCSFNELITQGDVKHKIFNFKTKNGDIKTVEVNGKTSTDYVSKKTYTHCLLTDITEKKAMQDKIHYIAHHDLLTKLPNKIVLVDRILGAIESAKRNHSKFALLILGVDNFKDINDSYGHIVGDELLLNITDKLHQICRKSDFIAKTSGDTFAILCNNNDDKIENYSCIASKVLDTLNTTYTLGNDIVIYSTVSIGIAIYPDNATIPNQLLQHSDSALFLAKKEHKGNFRFYNDELTQKAIQNINLASSLQNGIKNEELIVLFQPQICIKSGKIVGGESLVRWYKDGKIVNPNEFIKFAEERGLINGITRYVVKQSILELNKILPYINDNFKLSINISSLEITNKLFIQEFLDNLINHKIKIKNIGIEITESIFIRNFNGAIENIKELKNHGITVSLDDFGTGYSSLSYLKQLPLDIIKIDKSFIEGISHNSHDAQIAKTIISMAKILDFKVLAEGVETKEQLEFLKTEGCDYYQGYYFSKALNAKEFLELIKKEDK